MTAEEYGWSDGWLLLSVIYAQSDGQSPLDRIVAAGDGINHAIFTYEELEGGLRRLCAGGFIEQVGESLALTHKALNAYSSISEPRKRIYNELEDISRLLESEENPGGEDRGVNLSMKAYEAAVNAYMRRGMSED